MKVVRIDTSGSVARHHLRRFRFLPLLLFALVVSTLALVTLSHLAVVHRVGGGGHSQPSSGFAGGGGQFSANASEGQRRGVTARVKGQRGGGGGAGVKLEPLLSRNVTPVEKNALLLTLAISQKRVEVILKMAEMRNWQIERWENGEESVGNFSGGGQKVDNWSEEVDNSSWVANWTVSSPCGLAEMTPLLPYCHQVPPNLDGPLLPENHIHDEKVETMAEVVRTNGDVCMGGWWRPHGCSARHRVAVIVPYRDREEHLSTLLSHLHPILKKQQLDYKIYVAEQSGNGTFNKGILMNAAFLLSMKEANFHCFVFHDVDLIPEDDRNMYSCPRHPRHMSVAVNEFKYRLPYTLLVGGVFSISAEHFLRVNGYSNLYWGWGGEDDDMSARILNSGLTIIRPSSAIARYRMIKHVKRKPLVWKIRGKLLGTAKRRMRFDGLNTLKFTLLSTTVSSLYTNFTIEVGKNPFPSDVQ